MTASVALGLLRWFEDRGALVLDEEHDKLGGPRVAFIPAHDVNVVVSLVIGLSRRHSSSPFDLRGVSVTGEAGSDDLARAGAGRLSLIQRRYGGARPLDRRRAALLRGLPGPAPGRQRLLRHG